jgi:hypothetical protein
MSDFYFLDETYERKHEATIKLLKDLRFLLDMIGPKRNDHFGLFLF